VSFAAAGFGSAPVLVLPHFRLLFVFPQLFILGKTNQGLVEFAASFAAFTLNASGAYATPLRRLHPDQRRAIMIDERWKPR